MKMMKAGRLVFFTAGFIILMMMVSVFVSDAASDPITITLDGKTVSTDADPIMVQNRTMVPVSAIVGALGGTSSWDQDSHTATFVKGSTTVKVTIGSKTATVNGVSKGMDVAPQLVKVDNKGGARTMVPLRFISEGFGYDVAWDNPTRTVIIKSPSNSSSGSGSIVTEPSYTVSSTKVTAGQKISGDSSNTYTNVQITSTTSLKSYTSGTWLSNPYRYFIDFKDSKLGTDAASAKSVSASGSPVTSVRGGTQSGNIVRIVIDMSSKVTPKVSYSSDGKTMTLSFKESASTDNGGSSNSGSTDNNNSNSSSGSNSNTNNGSSGSSANTNTGTNTTTPTVTAPDSVTVNNTVKHDSLTTYAPYADGKITVVIDPGHGKTTGGKRSPDSSLMEWEFNRDVAYRLKDLLEAQGYTVIMTVAKDDQTDPSLASRVAVANNAENVDLFVSIHANANGNGKTWNRAHGWEIWIHKSGGVSEKAAKAIEAATKASITEFTDRGIKKTGVGEKGLYVSRNTEMPSVLIEHGFYTNQSECQLMKTSAFRQRLAQADATGIINFFNSFK